jgi:nicotinamidase-related amidase
MDTQNEFVFDPKKTALVIIDLQEGIVVMPAAPHTPSDVVERASRLADMCRKAGVFVVIVHVGWNKDCGDRLFPIADQPMAMRGSEVPSNWSDIVPGLTPHAGDHVLLKRQWGAFNGTDLDLQLRRRRIDTIILCGISTNIGVESTARVAYELGYQQVFIEDAMTARSQEAHEGTIQRIFPRIGLVRDTFFVENLLRL